jgi:hypothetical protein
VSIQWRSSSRSRGRWFTDRLRWSALAGAGSRTKSVCVRRSSASTPTVAASFSSATSGRGGPLPGLRQPDPAGAPPDHPRADRCRDCQTNVELAAAAEGARGGVTLLPLTGARLPAAGVVSPQAATTPLHPVLTAGTGLRPVELVFLERAARLTAFQVRSVHVWHRSHDSAVPSACQENVHDVLLSGRDLRPLAVEQFVELLACPLRRRYSRFHGDASSCRRRQPATLGLATPGLRLC